MVVSVSERVVLKDMTCPVIRLNQSRRRDKSVSFSISLFLHILIFTLVGISFIKAPQFAVDQGASSIEVNLVAAPSEVSEQTAIETPVEKDPEFTEKEIIKPVPVPIEKQTVSKTTGKDKATLQSAGGAITEAKPDYLKNPAPAYPESARRRGQEGLVLLKTLVDKNGYPVKIEIEKSSGYKALDEAALKAVKSWQFRPGQLGNIPVESSVRIPIRFDLRDSQ